MVVLSTALEPRADAEAVGRLFSISRSADGFFLEKHPKLDPVATATDGVFVVGCCQSPKDIGDSVNQATGAAARVLDDLLRLTPTPDSYALAARLHTVFGNRKQAAAIRTEARRASTFGIPK